MSRIARFTAIRDFDRYIGLLPTIDGWFSREAATLWWTLLDYQEDSEVCGDLLEIGVWRGKAALMLMLRARAERGERCVLIDDELRVPDLEYQAARMGLILENSATVMECNARNLPTTGLPRQPPRRFRWIHIDEEHTARAIREDLCLAPSLLCDGGIVCINGYMSTTHPEVTAAILRYAEEVGELRMFLGGFDKAYFTTQSHFRLYMEYCHMRVIDDLEKRMTFATLTKKTRADSLNFFGICDRCGDRRIIGLDGEDHLVEF